MEQWEYQSNKFKIGGFLGGKLDPEEFEAMLNQYGMEGWSWFPVLTQVNIKANQDKSFRFSKEESSLARAPRTIDEAGKQ